MRFRFFLITIAAFWIGSSSLAQNKLDIDSLLTSYQSQKLDTNKLKTVNNIVNYYMYRAIDSAKVYAHIQHDLALQLNNKKAIALALYQQASVFNNLNQLDSAKSYYAKSLNLAKELNNGVYKSQAYRGLAIIEYSQGNLIKADSINDLDLINTQEINDSMGTALAYDLKGSIFQNRGYYSIAFTNTLKALNLFEQLGDSIRIADTYNHLATLEYNMENFQNSIDYNSKALKIYEDYDDVYYQAQALNDLGVMHMKLGKYEEAASYYERSLIKSKAAKVSAIQAATLTNIGTNYLEAGNYNKAIDYLTQSVNLATSINAKRRIAIANNLLARIYIETNQAAKAIPYASQALEYANENKALSTQALATKRLSEASEMLGQTNKALEYHKSFKALNDSLINKEKIKTIEEQRIVFDSEKKEAALRLQEEEIDKLSAQTKNDRLTKTLYGIALASLLLILGLFYFGFKQRIKKNRLAREKQEAIYIQELEFKKKELASQTLHLVQKNTFIQELKDNLEKIKKQPELFKIEFRRLILLLKKESAEDKDWEVFKSYFSQVHNNFDQTLMSLSDEISEKDIRLASFLRMNLTTKEIANMLNVLPDSVLKSKYRLKKKLGLDKDQSLGAYLNTL